VEEIDPATWRRIMRIFALALALAAMSVLPAAHGRERVPPEKLTVVALRAHVKKFLDDPKRRDDLKEFNDKLVLSVEGLKYARTRSGYEVVWDVVPKKGVSLDAAVERLLKLGLEDTLRTAVSQGDLLTTDVGIDFRVRIVRSILPPPTPDGTGEAGGPSGGADTTPSPTVTVTVPRMSSEYVWSVVPNPYGCPPAFFILSEVPVPVLPPAVWHGKWPASPLTIETPPRMEYATDDVSADLFGVAVVGRRPLARMSVAGMTAADAPRLYYRGYALFFARDYAAAARNFRAASELDGNDARTWYYLALAERERGDREAANQALAQAVRLHRKGLPKSDLIGRALERVQGPARTWLRDALDRNETEAEMRVVGR
jgi:hypothetical protein